MAYASLAEVKAQLKVTTTTDDVILQAMIDAAERHIDVTTDKRHIGETDTRYYRQDAVEDVDAFGLRDSREVLNPQGKVLYLDRPLLEVATLTNGDGTSLASSAYWLEPRNEPRYDPIRLKSAYSWVFSTDGEVAVAGLWGWSLTPDPLITQATIELVAYLYRLKDTSNYDVTVYPQLGGAISIPKGIPASVTVKLAGFMPVARW